MMKTKFLFALVLSFACVFQLNAQGDVSSATGINVKTLRAGKGAKPAPGQDYLINVNVKNQKGDQLFTNRDMNVPIHGVIGKDTDKESTAIYTVMKSTMQRGGTYRLEVPKDLLKNEDQANNLEGDYIVYEVELIDFSDAKTSGADVVTQVLDEKGADAAQDKFDALKSNTRDDVEFFEWDMNAAGYDRLKDEKTDDAIAIFQMNVELNPKSWNAYDSLGDAYAAKGDTENAKASYQKALELNPNFTASKEKLEKL
ncbi:MAG: tetratricopeptide repeat protein [Lewinellaceae bacterium]|nr:tetratricopeptide repeat protein [Saprospiraceae bacterium]MCB9330078.1 tetratricopeptide repeat protein [Lewinellaceae bacterium]